jgi:HEAT repeat protein
LAVEPSPNAKLAGKNQPEPIEVQFADFKFSADPAGPAIASTTPSATSEDPESRALFAAQAKQPSAELAVLLKDKNPLVRLNATTTYIGFKDTTVEEALIANSLDLDPSIAGAALTALQAEGSDTARAIVKRSISVSLSDYAKMTAGRLIAETKDPKAAEDVSRLLANRSWQAHVLAVEGLAQIATPESQTFRMAFIGMSDPAVKLAVTRNADVSLDRVASALLWSAVNEPSDRVRAESYIKLIQSSVPTNKSEGYKGVRDDSKFVRKLVLEFLGTHPSEEHRNALRTAIADRTASVRAASLVAFAALEQAVTLDEIGNVLDDLDPGVQLALINVAKKKGLKLPQKTIDSMLASPDTEVNAAAKSIASGTTAN